jgi:hypothetical protein
LTALPTHRVRVKIATGFAFFLKPKPFRIFTLPFKISVEILYLILQTCRAILRGEASQQSKDLQFEKFKSEKLA